MTILPLETRAFTALMKGITESGAAQMKKGAAAPLFPSRDSSPQKRNRPVMPYVRGSFG